MVRPQPLWLRVATLLCVLLVGAMSTAQAAHIHGQWLPHSTHEVGTHLSGPAAAAEDVCPLCVAMHSAMPSGIAPVLGSVLVPVLLVSVAPLPHVSSPWHFELFSRPPPAVLL